PGIPDNAPRADMERFEKVDAERTKFIAGSTATGLNTTGWTTHEWLHFLRRMPDSLSVEQMTVLDKQYNFTQSTNSEIANLWYVLAIRAEYTQAYAAVDDFLGRVGRRKFLATLYDEMMATGKQQMARDIYRKYSGNYHPLAQATFDKTVLNGND